jgi:hypothetical protein
LGDSGQMAEGIEQMSEKAKYMSKKENPEIGMQNSEKIL